MTMSIVFGIFCIPICSVPQVMTSMGEEPVSEQEFQDFAKVVISLLKQFVGLVYSPFPPNILSL